MVLWAAKRLGPPVKWRADRTETFLCDPHGRDHVTEAEMAFDESARILGMKVRTIAAMGAYLFDFGPRIPTVAGGRIQGTVYDMQAVNAQVRCAFTNTAPTDAYRGAGRPETAYVIERLLDQGAAAFGLAREEIRARNYVTPAQVPYTNCAGSVLDSGRFAETQGQALALADWDGFAARAAASRAAGKLRGRGIGYFIEASGGQPMEWARVASRPRARRWSMSAPSAMARATRPPSPRCCMPASASPTTGCASSRATATWCRPAAAPAAAVPRRWAASPCARRREGAGARPPPRRRTAGSRHRRHRAA
jgi:carbon-monoxide dehydrogenase large subunit